MKQVKKLMPYDLLLLNVMRNSRTQSTHFADCLGQHSIAAYLSQYAFTAKVYSCDVTECKSFLNKEIARSGVQLIGFYAAADNIHIVENIIAYLKQTTTVTTIVGGPQAYALQTDFFCLTGCDYVIRGEGEKPMLALLSHFYDHVGNLEDIESLSFLKTDGTLYQAPLATAIESLDDLPFASVKNSYTESFRSGTSIGVLTGRGCPYHCAFCYEGATSKYVRYRSVSNVMAEIDEAVSRNKKLRYICIYDDTFTLDMKRVYQFCKEFKKRNLFWTCEAHVRTLFDNLEALPVMVASGLRAFQIGIESGCQLVLDAYGKNTSPEMILEVVRESKKAGVLIVEGNYIIGGAHETNETLQESLAHAMKLIEIGRGMVEIKSVFFAPYHGTKISNNMAEYGLRFDKVRSEHEIITMAEPVVFTECLSTEDISNWKKQFDSAIKRKYEEEIEKCKKSDILPLLQDSSLQRTSQWYVAWMKNNNRAVFADHCSISEQTFGLDKYPIRVGFDYRIGQDEIWINNHVISGEAAAFWLNCDGRRKFREIADLLMLTKENAFQICQSLNEDCLLYYSDF